MVDPFPMKKQNRTKKPTRVGMETFVGHGASGMFDCSSKTSVIELSPWLIVTFHGKRSPRQGVTLGVLHARVWL